MTKLPTVLAIDTSCDETSASVVRGLKILSNIQPSQIEFHKKYGGVVPSVARLAHKERIDNVVKEALKRAQIKKEEIDYVAVTKGPGLSIALEVGIQKAKELAIELSKPLIAINHMEGHLLSGFAQRNSKNTEEKINLKQISSKEIFPALGILVSGGHTEFILVKNIGEYKKIGETQDDSCGEAFDKSGRIMGLGYPAGPVISEFAKQNRKNIKIEIEKRNLSTILIAKNIKTNNIYELPIPMLNSGDLNMSYSGLKTAFSQLVKDLLGKSIKNKKIENRLQEEKELQKNLTKQQILDLCVTFEAAAFEQLLTKTQKAIKKYNPKEIWLGGGVVASNRLKYLVRKLAKQNSITNVRIPYSKKLTTDNAAMIGLTANIDIINNGGLKNSSKLLLQSKSQINSLDRDPNLSL